MIALLLEKTLEGTSEATDNSTILPAVGLNMQQLLRFSVQHVVVISALLVLGYSY